MKIGGLRYVIQAMVMISDLLILAAMAAAAWFVVNNIVSLVGFLVACLIVVSYRRWRSTGIFASWRPSKARAFLDNAKKMGL